MILDCFLRLLFLFRISRTCGGDPLESLREELEALVFPAHAGVILCLFYLPYSLSSISRTCGGDPSILRFNALIILYFPHMRG